MKHAYLLAVGGLACSQTAIRLPLPEPESPEPLQVERGAGAFRAGFGSVDITPPPGLGLSGNGPEGQQARGWRHRLSARAMLLEDSDGERIAYLVVDVPHVSSLLHRMTAALTVADPARVGADRLILSATHTHSSVANNYSSHGYNRMAGPLEGFDEPWVEFLVERMAQAVHNAAADLAPARARWSWGQVDGVIENRSLPPFMANPERMDSTVDDTLYMLRIDHCADQACGVGAAMTPRGAFGVFGIHGTGYPTTGNLMDGDIQAVVQRRVERLVDAANGVDTVPFRPDGVFVFANGTEGDVTPTHSDSTRCERELKQLPVNRPSGPRTPAPPPEEWSVDPAHLELCHDSARASVRRIGGRLADSAVARYERTVPDRPMTIQRAFTTLHLPSTPHSPQICPEPRFGTANVGGAFTDGKTRLYGWSILWFIPTGFEPGPRAVRDPPHGCHGEKKVGLGFFLQGLVAGEHVMPEYAQFSVVRVGRVLIASVPWEVTTVAGRRIKRALRAKAPAGVEQVIVVGLANGYFQYLTTPEEYRLQHYEGGSMQYGRNTLPLVIDVLEELTESLSGEGEPTVTVGPIVAYPGEYRTHFRPRDTGPAVEQITRSIERLTCDHDGVTVEWVDAAPGRFQPSDGPVIQFYGRDSTLVAWDDRPDVEVTAVRDLGDRGYLWRGRYRVEGVSGRVDRVVILGRDIMQQDLVGTCPGSTSSTM